jgi:UDP-N-acetylmuramate dehydrogenase
MSARWQPDWSADFRDVVFVNDAEMSRRTTIGIGGPADTLAMPASAEALAGLLRRAAESDVPVRMLGGGSNLLISDSGVRGLVISLGAEVFRRIEVSANGLFAGAGASLGSLVRRSASLGLSGLECLAGIPGTVGGALRGNAGGRHGAVGDAVRSVLCMNAAGEILVRQAAECGFAYRDSALKDVIVLGAEFKLAQADPEDITLRMRKILEDKKRSQPYGERSAGCFFKNPPAMPAGLLIERMGFKGRRAGGAAISTRHANFIVNLGGATCSDVIMLAREIRKRAKIEFDIDLELEVETWGVPEEAWAWA